MRAQIAAVVLAVAMLGCPKGDSDGPSAPTPISQTRKPVPPPRSVVLPEVPAQAPDAAQAPQTPHVDIVPYEKDSDPVAEYAKDCHHVFTVTVDTMDGKGATKPECEARHFAQNCFPDQFGCWDAEEICADGCAKPCGQCQTKCASTCDTCKTTCRGDAGCAQDCAVATYKCRFSCLDGLTACREKDCIAAETACMDKGTTELAKMCPDCAAIDDCVQAGDPTDCHKKFPKDDLDCFKKCRTP